MKAFSGKRAREPDQEVEQAREIVDDDAMADEALQALGAAALQPPAKRPRVVGSNRSLFVRRLPEGATSDALTTFFSQHFPVKHATVVLDPTTNVSRGFGFVTLADAEDATKAKDTLNNKQWNGRRIKIDLAESRTRGTTKSAEAGVAGQSPGDGARTKARPRPQSATSKVSTRLIIRNLPWSVRTPDQLTSLFQGFGKIKYTDLPSKNGKLSGFGFVTFRGRKNAEKAMDLNGKTIDGRMIAVDWAVEKEVWEKHQNQEDIAAVDKPKLQEVASVRPQPRVEAEAKPKSRAETSVRPVATPVDADEQLKADLDNFMKDHMNNMDDEDEEERDAIDQDDNEEAMDQSEPIDSGDDGVYDEDGHRSTNLPVITDDGMGDDNESDAGITPRPSHGVESTNARHFATGGTPEKMADVSATVFVRNLPFVANDESLKDFFGRFGSVRYARVVLDKTSGLGTGNGFVCFWDKEHAATCVKNAPRVGSLLPTTQRPIVQDYSADPKGHYTFDGRILNVMQAVSKEKATYLTADAIADRKRKDKRRVFLLSEGAIHSQSALYKIMTPGEKKMREASINQRTKLIRTNPNLHCSLTRLAIRNIPHDLSSKELKVLARSAVVEFAKDVTAGRRQPLSTEEKARGGDEAKDAEHRRKLKGKGIVTQCKIVFETRDGTKTSGDQIESTGKSRGYGFVEYVSHRWALMGLRWLNGHQVSTKQGDKKLRLIAEFAIENAQVVMRRRANEVKDVAPVPSRAPSTLAPSSTPTAGLAGRSMQSRAGRGKMANPSASGSGGRRNMSGDKGENKPSINETKSSQEEAKEVQQRVIARKRIERRRKALGRG